MAEVNVEEVHLRVVTYLAGPCGKALPFWRCRLRAKLMLGCRRRRELNTNYNPLIENGQGRMLQRLVGVKAEDLCRPFHGDGARDTAQSGATREALCAVWSNWARKGRMMTKTQAV